MSFRIWTEQRATTGGRDGTVYILQGTFSEDSADCPPKAEIWPAFGFNCYRWQMAPAWAFLDLLYAEPQLFHSGSPTRSGIPVLFPFPNRIREGRFTCQGRTYQLPCNDSAGKNANHGFACRRPWRVVDHGADGTSAWVTGEFRGSVDAADARELWPADYQLRLTYRLMSDRLRLTATVHNPDAVVLPFGLGFHPYFRVAPEGGSGEDCLITAAATQYWELADSLPTGDRRSVDGPRDLRRPRRFTDLHLDDVLTGLPGEGHPETDHLYLRGTLSDESNGAQLRLFTSAGFRELVVFTPQHRQAMCLEPYTCTTDAINLQERGIDAGLQVLSPGATWQGVVELRVEQALPSGAALRTLSAGSERAHAVPEEPTGD
jgi:aldose 1-epimerase